ncbi:hypothetical protein TUM20985_00370 [Mycobacterium antarcticum]|nr:hypothetical protein TUM20985_00370 [Mycolicibacterium sp. TUM20985]
MTGKKPTEGVPWPYGMVPQVIGLASIGVLAFGMAVSATLGVSRPPFANTSAALPTIPVTASAISAATTQAPSRVPTTTPSWVDTPSADPRPTQPLPKPPENESTRAQNRPPISVHPTPHRPFPHQTTDFRGPPGTNG